MIRLMLAAALLVGNTVYAQTEALEKAETYRAKVQEAQEALAAGNADEGQQATRRAETLLNEALTAFRDWDVLERENSEALRVYGELEQDAGNYDLAAEAWERVVRMAPDDGEAWYRYGSNLSLLGAPRFAQAVSALRTAIERTDRTEVKGAAHTTLGRTYFEQGYFEFAEEQYREAIALAGENPRPKVGLAAVEFRDGNVVEAIDLQREAGPIAPEWAHEMSRLMDTARVDFEARREYFPDTAEHHLAYAQLLVQSNYMASALRPLERAVTLEPENIVALNMLGSINMSLGQSDEAREAFEKSLEINPGQPRTRQSLDQLNGAGAQSPAVP